MAPICSGRCIRGHVVIGIAALLSFAPGAGQWRASAQDAAKPAPVQTLNPSKEVEDALAQAREARNQSLAEGRKALEQALSLAREKSDKIGEIRCLTRLGRAMNDLGELSAAKKLLEEQALPLARAAGDLRGEADAHYVLSIIAEIDPGLVGGDRWLETLERFRKLGDKKWEANTLTCLAMFWRTRGYFPRSLDYAKQALAAARIETYRYGEAYALKSIADVQLQMGHPREAIRSAESCLSIMRELKDLGGEKNLCNIIGDSYRLLGQLTQARLYLNRALSIGRDEGSRGSQIGTLNLLGLTYSLFGEPKRGGEIFREALRLSEGLEGTGEMGWLLLNLAETHRQLGEAKETEDLYRRAEEIFRREGDISGESALLINSAIHCKSLGQAARAIDRLNRAIEIARDNKNQYYEAAATQVVGSTYAELGDPQRAIPYYRKAIELNHATGNPSGEAAATNNLGLVYAQIGQYALASRLCDRGAVLHRSVSDRDGEGFSFHYRSLILSRQGRLDEAIASVRKAILLFRRSDSRLAEADAHRELGHLLALRGDLRAAIESLSIATGIARRAGLATIEAGCMVTLADIYRHSSRPEEAEAVLNKAMRIVDRQREQNQALSAETRIGTGFGTGRDTYVVSLLLAADQRDPDHTLDVAQRLKARTLLDLMSSGSVRARQGMTEDEQRADAELRVRCASLNQRMVAEGVKNEVGSKKRYEALAAELRKAEQELLANTDRLNAKYPSLAAVRVAKTATAREVRASLTPDEAQVEFVMVEADPAERQAGWARDTLITLVTTRRGTTVRTLAIPAAELARRCSAVRAACSDPRKDWKPAARDLYRLLLDPLRNDLSRTRRLVICPDGPLWDVPFAAVIDRSGNPLLSRMEVNYGYSATALLASEAVARRASHRLSTASVMAMANPAFASYKQSFGNETSLPGQRPISTPDRPISSPDRPIDAPARDLYVPRGSTLAALPGTQREADAIRRLFGSSATVYTRNFAQEATAKKEAPRSRYLHFATHGFFNDASPMLSSLVLAEPPKDSQDDGFLTAREIFDLDLSGVEMVVLSACNMGRGQKRTGEGLFGMSWALFAAGVPTQVLSQWAVNDASTAALMTDFYGKIRSGESKGAALRQAALSTSRRTATRHPYYWAPFVLMGNSR